MLDNDAHLLSILCTDHMEMKTCMHFCQYTVHYSDTKCIHLWYNLYTPYNDHIHFHIRLATGKYYVGQY